MLGGIGDRSLVGESCVNLPSITSNLNGCVAGGALGHVADVSGFLELPKCCCSLSEQCQVCTINPIDLNSRPKSPEPALYRTNLWEHLKQVKKLSFAGVPGTVADKKRKVEEDAALTRDLASMKIGSNLVLDFKKLRTSTQQDPCAGPALSVNCQTLTNSAPLMYTGNGETVSTTILRAPNASSSDLSRRFQHGSKSFGLGHAQL